MQIQTWSSQSNNEAKQGSLFGFVTLISPKPWHFMLCSWNLWKALNEWGAHQLGLRLFGAWMWKLLIIESFSQCKLYEIENKQCIEIWGCSWNALGKSDLIDFISQFSELRCGDIDFWVDFVAGNSNNLQKLGLEGKVSWALNVFTHVYFLLEMCSRLGQWHALH
jgi:hypothetical protein